MILNWDEYYRFISAMLFTSDGNQPLGQQPALQNPTICRQMDIWDIVSKYQITNGTSLKALQIKTIYPFWNYPMGYKGK